MQVVLILRWLELNTIVLRSHVCLSVGNMSGSSKVLSGATAPLPCPGLASQLSPVSFDAQNPFDVCLMPAQQALPFAPFAHPSRKNLAPPIIYNQACRSRNSTKAHRWSYNKYWCCKCCWVHHSTIWRFYHIYLGHHSTIWRFDDLTIWP